MYHKIEKNGVRSVSSVLQFSIQIIFHFAHVFFSEADENAKRHFMFGINSRRHRVNFVCRCFDEPFCQYELQFSSGWLWNVNDSKSCVSKSKRTLYTHKQINEPHLRSTCFTQCENRELLVLQVTFRTSIRIGIAIQYSLENTHWHYISRKQEESIFDLCFCDQVKNTQTISLFATLLRSFFFFFLFFILLSVESLCTIEK